jgi:hypothetical protein
MSDKTHARWPELPDNLKNRIVTGGIPTKHPELGSFLHSAEELMLRKMGIRETPKRAKYGNKRVQCDGHWFDSIKEKDYYLELQLRKNAGDVKDFKLQPKYYYIVFYGAIDSTVSFSKMYWYQGDFEIVYPDGRIEVVDVKSKGTITREFKRKKMIVNKLYNIDILLA